MKSSKNTQQGFAHIVMIVVVVAVVVLVFLGWRAASDNADTNLSIDSTSEQTPLLADLSGVKSIEEIQALAVSQAGDANVVGIELETNDDTTVYVVHLSDGTRLVFDAKTGEVGVLNDDDDDEIGELKQIPAGFKASISITKAVEIAKTNRPNSTVEKVKFEVEKGVVVYSVRFTDESRVDVNAKTGKVQRLKDEKGTDVIKVDDDFDDDGVNNSDDDDDDNDGIKDTDDDDDDNDGVKDTDDDDDDNDGVKDADDDDDEEDEEEDEEDEE